MSGRRGYKRYALSSSWTGAVRVLRDVIVDGMEHDELLAVSQVPGLVGEEMTLGLLGASGSIELRVRVVESRPVLIDGGIRHELRLSVMTAEGAAPIDTAAEVA